jgi:hypothetical protein
MQFNLKLTFMQDVFVVFIHWLILRTVNDTSYTLLCLITSRKTETSILTAENLSFQDGVSRCLQNAGTYLPHHTTRHMSFIITGIGSR